MDWLWVAAILAQIVGRYMERGDNNIEWGNMIPTWWGGYEKEIRTRALNENAIAAIELFESSGFYRRWVKMRLEGY